MTAISEAERARRQSELEERRAGEASEWASLRAELEALLTERWHAELTAISEALAERTNEVLERIMPHSSRRRVQVAVLDAQVPCVFSRPPVVGTSSEFRRIPK